MSEGNGKHPEQAAVFCGMPCGGEPSILAARAFYRSTDGRYRVHLCYQQSSLLNANCNGLWAAMLNARRDGRKLDYFAMLHADVQPPDHWLNLMLDELNRTRLDVLSAVIPIKDGHGLTSTAVGREDGDDWHPLCRVTMRELFDLPETFTAADLGFPAAPLLINTGCFVARLGNWAEQVHFEGRDRIVLKDGRFAAENEPEDWNFGRQLHALGLKVGATRRLPLTHRGQTDFTNTAEWGDYDFDRQYLSERVLPGPKDGWRFPSDVNGWLSEDEGRKLASLAAGKDVLEVGSYMGRSTICLARGAVSVTCVDTFDGRATPRQRPTLEAFRKNIERHGVDGRVRVRTGTSAEVLPTLADPFDLIFIDAAHDEASVRQDIELSTPLLAPGGLVCFHDYNRPGDEGVKAAVDACLLSHGGTLVSLTDTLAVVRPAATLAPV